MNTTARPRISVIIPSYNHAEFIGQAIDSVLADRGDDVELVVADDASTDGSRSIIAGHRDPRMRLIELRENRGPSAALNAAVEASRGEYIAVLGSDDFLLPGTLRKQVAFLDGHAQYDAVFGMPRWVDERGQPLNKGYGVFAHPFVAREVDRAEWLRRFFFAGNCLSHPTAMLRRSLHETVGLYDRRLLNLQDFDFWIRIAVSGRSFFVLPDELTATRIRSNQMNLSAPTVSATLRTHFEQLQVLGSYRQIPVEYLYRIFAIEVSLARIETNLNAAELIAEIGARSKSPLLQLFGLQTLYNSSDELDGDCRRLFKLAGTLDPIGIVRRR